MLRAERRAWQVNKSLVRMKQHRNEISFLVCPETPPSVSGTALAAGYWRCFYPRLAPCGSLFQVSGQPASHTVLHVEFDQQGEIV